MIFSSQVMVIFLNTSITALMAVILDISAFENLKNVNYLYFRSNLTLKMTSV